MIFLQYKNYEDVYNFYAKEEIVDYLKTFMKHLYSCYDLEFYIKNIKTNDIFDNNDCLHSIPELIYANTYDYYYDCDFESCYLPEIKKSIVKLCKHYGIKEFKWNGINLLKEVKNG